MNCKHVLQCESPAPKPPKTPESPSTPVTPMQALSLNIQIPITSGIPASLRIQKAAAGSVLKQINDKWTEVYEKPFSEVVAQLPKSDIQKKLSSTEWKRKLRNLHTKVRK